MKCKNCNFWLEYRDDKGVCWRTDEPKKSTDSCVYYITIKGKKEFAKKVSTIPRDKCEIRLDGVYIDIKDIEPKIDTK